MSLEKIKSDRLNKLERIKKTGITPYPAKTGPRQKIDYILDNFDVLVERSENISLAGRLRSIRIHGGSTFADVEDASGKIQIFLKKDGLKESLYDFFVENFDLGDFVRVSGEPFKTKKGELTLLVKDFEILAKSLNQLPEKWHGLTDVEERFRRRYLDLLMNREVARRFEKRSEIIKKLRDFMTGLDFIEVETPILQALPGGALAKPFKTHLNALDMDLYLRIAPELYLKRLIVGGFEKVFEIGKCFRNEGMDKTHNPDFTMMEFYWAYASYEDLMDLTEKIFETLVPQGRIEFQGEEIFFKAPFERITMRDLILKEFSIDLDKASQKEIMAELKKRGVKPEDDKECRSIDALFKLVRPSIIKPTFILDHPMEMSPLAKEKENEDSQRRYAERFQFIVGGIELINAYSEQNNPQEQAMRLREQEKLHQDEVRFDEDFIEALEYGMPPTAGWGMGIDRLVQLLTDAPNIREVILFPIMRPKGN
ncbi:MAG: lysine--tRNA ligase [Candidatus Portnoybacteria bacterium]|nr:lysine--tRNA ligase [Candidatus Portnoybacteria bacterium]